MRLGARSQDGFTLVEVLLATTLMSIGIAATLSVFGSSGRSTVVSQQTNVAASQAQAAIDQLSTMSYNKLGHTSTPASSTNPKDPGSRVSGATLLIKTGLSESFVLSTDSGQSAAAVNPAPTPFSVGTAGGVVDGYVYRYVTWRDETCQNGVCDGAQNTKRITVAVTINQVGTNPVLNPVWLSEVVTDPAALPAGASSSGSTNSGANPVSAQNFYLYNTTCNQSTRQAISGPNETHNTASFGYSPDYTLSHFSTCETSTTSMRPDLMGKTVPPGTSSTPIYKYSTDLSGSYSGGLAMKKGVTSCPRYYYDQRTTSDPAAANNKWTIHAWASPPFATNFGINGQATVSLFTSTLGGVAAKGVICATVTDRYIWNGYPIDRVLGSSTYTLDPWPATTKRTTFTFAIPDDADILAGHRLMLFLSVMDTSTSDLSFIYDHPTYASFLEIATDTPY